MKLKPSRTQLIFSGFFVGIIIILTSFQNCGTQDYSDSLGLPSTPDVNANNADEIPFAFDYRVNQITYMSCSRSKDKVGNLQSSTTHLNNPSVFFTFKMGSYPTSSMDAAGLTFRKEFIDYVIANLTHKGTITDTNIQNAITNATAHGGAALQFGIRESTPIASSLVYFSGGGSPVKSVDYDLIPQNLLLTSNEFLPQLLQLFKKPLPRLTTLGTASLQTYRLEGAINYQSLSHYDEMAAQQIRDQLSSEAGLSQILTVTYSKDLRVVENLQTSYEARGTHSLDSSNRVWGTGFNLKFQSATNGTRWKENILKSVTESDLSNFNTMAASTWSCPSHFRYLIVSPQDRNPGGAYPCKDPNESQLTPQQMNTLTILRRHLPSSEWIIDPEMECISPRKTHLDCYGNRAFNPIDYYGSASRCGLDDNNNYLHRDCAEYVSVCLRN